MRDSQVPRTRLRAMVTDNDPVTRMVLAAVLQEMGFNAQVAEDEAAALDAARRAMPDLFILDVQMPQLDGFETCAAIREIPGGEDVPILIVTRRDDLPCIERAFEVGATDFVTKPIDAALLQKRLRFQMRASGAFREVNDALAELQASRRRLDRSQQLARLGDWEWNLETDRLILSVQASEIMDCASDPPSSSLDFFARCVHPDDRDTASKSLQKVHETSKSVQFEHRVLDGERVVHHFLEADEPIPGEGRTVAGTVQDITDRKRAEEQIRQLAFYDSLTGLPNRRLLEDHLGKALEWANHSGTRVGLLFVDLDRFKRVNDTLGHMAGDQILREVAERLLSSVRFSDSLARAPRSVAAQTSVSRFGGDEFAVVLSGLRDGQDAGRVAQRLLGNSAPTFHRPATGGDTRSQHRNRDLSNGWHGQRVPVPEGGHGDASRQGEGARQPPVLQRLDERSRSPSHGDREIAERGAGAEPHGALLPAAGTHRLRRDHPGGGPGAHARAQRRARAPRRIHPHCRGERPDHHAGRLGSSRRLPSARHLASRGMGIGKNLRQHLGSGAPSERLPPGRQRSAEPGRG